jgi:hypothetical protein
LEPIGLCGLMLLIFSTRRYGTRRNKVDRALHGTGAEGPRSASTILLPKLALPT